MARTAQKATRRALLPEGWADHIYSRLRQGAGLSLIALGVACVGALLSYSSADPSLNGTGGGAVRNWLGIPGAYVADLALQGFGLAGALPAVLFATWGWCLWRYQTISKMWARPLLGVAAVFLLAIAFSSLPVPNSWPLVTELGGVLGSTVMQHITQTLHSWGISATYINELSLSIVFAMIGSVFAFTALALPMDDWRAMGFQLVRFNHWLGHHLVWAIYHLRPHHDGEAPSALSKSRTKPAPRKKAAPIETRSSEPVVLPKAPSVKTGKKAQSRRQQKLDLGLGDDYSIPPLDLLTPPEESTSAQISKDALAGNAEMLSSVLNDFGVKGEIVKVRPGPVVTLYELEPAPGTRTSRVISLSDDIARSMSAVSVRVAPVPGQSVIGIEMPNQKREMVYLRELLGSEPFEREQAKLTLALGKDIGGVPMIVDLARMPHLLIAGTTGSGKSVGVNAMILSLLYQLSPDECKFIMIDPKMLELSVYDGIPHLLSPVVTDPSKAVVALKWAVREMEERYRAMSQLGVRNISGYNKRIGEAVKKGEVLTRRVQTGFDDDGKPTFEEQPLQMTPLPFIVVVVDEMADLMLVAGKDVESAIQRLAQMARAAGIHLIMATQRPSVDVITGTIKANFPTRISFQVTSKIDSRTILGEPGAEQLLGQGDMLYMAGGGRITRVHAPFVSDQEVEDVVSHLKAQATPVYMEDVTVEPEAPMGGGAGGGGNDGGDQLYDEAVALVAREGKASISFVQRHLQIGYNRAARIVEQMESQGVVSKANRVGRREVLINDVSEMAS